MDRMLKFLSHPVPPALKKDGNDSPTTERKAIGKLS